MYKIGFSNEFQFFHVNTKVLYSGHLKAQAIVNEAPVRASAPHLYTSVVHPGTPSPTIPEIFLIVKYCNLLEELQALGVFVLAVSVKVNEETSV